MRKIIWFSIILVALLAIASTRLRTRHLHAALRCVASKTQQWQNLQQTNITVLRTSARPVKISQFSDLHYEVFEIPPTLARHVAEQMIEHILQEKPDYVLITGDFVHGDVVQVCIFVCFYFLQSAPELAVKLLARMRDALQAVHKDTRQRLFGSMGNHDHHAGMAPQLRHILQSQSGIRILENEIAYLPEDDLLLVGLADYHHGYFEPGIVHAQMQHVPVTDRTTILVMSHIPDSAECLLLNKPEKAACSQFKSHILLGGHTHGGQFILPYTDIGIIPWTIENIPKFIMDLAMNAMKMWNPVRNWDWSHGLFVKQNDWLVKTYNYTIHIKNDQSKYMYVNRGVGGHFGIRNTYCSPEVTVLNLKQE